MKPFLSILAIAGVLCLMLIFAASVEIQQEQETQYNGEDDVSFSASECMSAIRFPWLKD